MFVGVLDCDLLLGDVHSLKLKRAIIRPLLTRLRRLEISVAEVGDNDVHRRAHIAVAVVANESGQVQQVLDESERIIADYLEVQLLAARQRIVRPDDL